MGDFHARVVVGATPPNNLLIGANIGFQAKTVYLDNYTAYYLYVPDADFYVAPFIIGTVLPLHHTTDYAKILVQSPFSNPQTPTDPSYFVNVNYVDYALPYQAGYAAATGAQDVNVVNEVSISELPAPTALTDGESQVGLLFSRIGVYNLVYMGGNQWERLRADSAIPDGTAGGALAVQGYGYDALGNTVQRLRSGQADNIASTGLQNIAPMVFDPGPGTFMRMRTPAGDGTINDGFAGIIHMGHNGATYDQLKAGLGNAGVAATGLQSIQPYFFNGTNYDAFRGNTTEGLKVGNSRPSIYVVQQPAANTGATLTLASGGVGIFHYITHIRIERSATAALAGTASLNITTTNLGGIAWKTGNAMVAGGTQIDVDEDFATPLRSAVSNTASTIVLPAPGAAVLYSAWVTYYTGP